MWGAYCNDSLPVENLLSCARGNTVPRTIKGLLSESLAHLQSVAEQEWYPEGGLVFRSADLEKANLDEFL
jgi:hypothetical protein